ncbi:DNA repair metallo-beta-lactamase [Penicillium waksmanii]|uniref:DNA repair metallo-beta-lactamase n=1 Tax=Penicillium waksmanii TaxID=69791 RepID=UPI00254979B0|nr:DNA repair metallo-beta-lactamase [Penicillium waksmanii]KAJ5999688.1 DNA repair metallo-beta-lactamase [Penicillium waksmanii]
MAGSFGRKASTPSKGFSAKPSSAKRNRSITTFFQKTDGPPGATSHQSRITQFVTASQSPSSGRGTPTSHNGTGVRNDSGGLFLEDRKGLTRIDKGAATDTSERTRSRTPDDIWGDETETSDADELRYHEKASSVKRQKVESPEAPVDIPRLDVSTTPKDSVSAKKTNKGPFIDESDSEDDMDAYRDLNEASPAPSETNNGTPSLMNDELSKDLAESEQPPPVRDATTSAGNEGYVNFDELEEEEFIGEEFLDKPWEDSDTERPGNGLEFDDVNDPINDESNSVSCPICQTALVGHSESEITVHVNDCLDGKPSLATSPPKSPRKPLSPIPAPPQLPRNTIESDSLKRSERAAIARPAQRDPYPQNASSGGSASAFSKMMAGNAEDSAWATASSNEVSSRGKQAYQRTCPFYKILNGFAITVDAFRYGAVEGCNAYFLSHFHSDHYIGLSKSWSHGPIYCSRPTANLVRMKLRVDPKWVVDLDFETPTDVPDTGGVRVTMIHANHCPGSSLFLFEKSFGNGPNIRRERILHCGDFRASVDHIRHPLLRPDPINPVTGKPRQQRLDKCYLDTTYLDPKYAFPSQESVITACSELCVRLNDEVGVGTDTSQVKVPGLMSKFLSSVTTSDRKQDQVSTGGRGGRLLVVVGTYSIGKERICIGIAKALGSKIFATPPKQAICACLEDPELSDLLTSDPREAQVHMQTLFELKADTLADYLDQLKPAFSRVVGFRPSGWTYRPPAGRVLTNPTVPTVLRGEQWRTPFTAQDLTPQRGDSFRELTMFCCALRIGKVIPTVNVGKEKDRDKMKTWIDRWEGDKRKNGLFHASEW